MCFTSARIIRVCSSAFGLICWAIAQQLNWPSSCGSRSNICIKFTTDSCLVAVWGKGNLFLFCVCMASFWNPNFVSSSFWAASTRFCWFWAFRITDEPMHSAYGTRKQRQCVLMIDGCIRNGVVFVFVFVRRNRHVSRFGLSTCQTEQKSLFNF